MRDVKILYRLEKQNIVPIRNCLLLNKMKTNRVEHNGGGGGEVGRYLGCRINETYLQNVAIFENWSVIEKSYTRSTSNSSKLKLQ